MRNIILILMLCATTTLSAQNLPERAEVRRGNKSFVGEDFATAAERYTAAMELAPDSYEARFNLGSALIKGGELEGGEKLLAELAADSLLCAADRSEAYFNLGNSQFEQQKLQEALESYKSAMRHSPSDMEAKYNYAYTKALLEQQENEDQQDQDQNQDQNQSGEGEGDPQGDPQQDNQDENEDQQDQDQEPEPQEPDQEDQQDQEEQPQNEQEQPSGIPEQEREQMLDAIQAQEDKTQEDLKEKGRGVVIPGAKNW